jgi:hypothetical protein
MMSGFDLLGLSPTSYPMIAYEVAETGGLKVAISIDIIDK